VPETSDYLGMLRKISPWVAWSKADREIVKTLIENRAKNKKPRSDSLSKSRNSKDYMGIDELVEVLVNDKIKFSEQNNVKPWFSLNPPKGGFKKSTKRQFSDGGTLGSNKDLLEIVKKMI
jgi:large subunit ribosomal protein L30